MANQYLTFAAPSTDTFSPTAWASMTGLLTQGFSTGIADTTEVNTLMRQLSVPVSALGQYISDAGLNALDDGNRTNFQTAFAGALKKNLLANDQNVWITDKGGSERALFAAAGANGTTTFKGYGATPFSVLNASETAIFSAKSDGRAVAGADAVSGLDLITYQQWAAGNNQYPNIINIPGSSSASYFMTSAECGSLVVINDQFAYNLVLPTAVGNAGRTVRVYNGCRRHYVKVFAPGATDVIYGPAHSFNTSYAGIPDQSREVDMIPRQDYEFISDGTSWIGIRGGAGLIPALRSTVTRAAFVGGNTSYTVSRRQTRVLRVTLVGAGGGGGGNGAGGSGAVLVTSILDPDVLASSPAFTFTVGAGGLAGTIQGTSGGATTLTLSGGFGFTYTAGGGFPGGAAGAGQQGGAGGVASVTGVSNAVELYRGNPGGNGTPGDTSLPGTGGGSPMFGGGGCGTLNGTATRAGVNGGGGGGGGLSSVAGVGGDGFIMFEEF